MKKLLVKKTGEILSIVSESQIKNFKFEFYFDFDKSNESSDEDDNELSLVKPNSSSKKKIGKYFKCTNKKTYHENDVIVGINEIREYKLVMF